MGRVEGEQLFSVDPTQKGTVRFLHAQRDAHEIARDCFAILQDGYSADGRIPIRVCRGGVCRTQILGSIPSKA